MKTVYRVKNKATRWTKSFKTLEEAQNYIKIAWEFKDDPNTYIEKVVTETV